MKISTNTILLCSMLAVSSKAQDIGTIEITEKLTSKTIQNISGSEVKSADLAESLHKKIPSVNIIRRSGIANDITLRGQKRDNIAVTIDDGMIFGACPNRMDPPTSHVLTSNIESIKVSEGPFDVENFGSLSGSVKIETKKPTEELDGEIYLNAGSFGYKKAGASISGGTNKVKIMLTASKEEGEQYKDGDNKELWEQLRDAVNGTAQSGMQYATDYKNLDAFEKKSYMLKSVFNIQENQELELSFTKNESDNILYPNSKMDALYDDSDIFNFRYELKNLGKYSKNLKIKAYKSDVEHPMSTKYRMSSGTNSVNEVISKLTTNKNGLKVINEIDAFNSLFTVGLDTNNRNWDGEYTGKGTKAGITGRKPINDVDTKNNAIFLKYDKNYGNLALELGTRYNNTTISTANSTYTDKDFNSLDLSLFTTYTTSNDTKYFIGIGKASRVPDARELYFTSSANAMLGTPTLDQTTNTEIDLGVEKNYENAYIKFKAFYSMLDDYIYLEKGQTTNAFTNIDAKIYGFELTTSYDFSEDLYLDFALAYQRGEKDSALPNQTDKDLADITPLKTSIALNYDYDNTLNGMIELVAAKKWNNYDSDNGEQAISGYGVVNMKVQKTFAKTFELTTGVDNLFDKTYAVSNTYADLILLNDGNSGEVMLLNEPGRYIYANIKYKF